MVLVHFLVGISLDEGWVGAGDSYETVFSNHLLLK